MTIESLPISTLHKDPANARLHSARNLDAIMSSLMRFGQQKPIVIDARNIVRAGNGTLEAAAALGWTHVNIVRTDLLDSEATAYAIADNRTSDLSEFDDAALAAQLESLRAEGMNLKDIGFDDRELKKLLDESLEPAEQTHQSIGEEKWLVLVTCEDEQDQTAFLNRMNEEGRTCKAIIG